MRCDNGIIFEGLTGLCVLLKRLAYPNRFVDLMQFFPFTRDELVRVFKTMVTFMKLNHLHRLEDIVQPWMDIDKYVNAISDKGSPNKRCFGFIDGTVRAMCRPSRDQEKFYNGHKRTHGIKFQSVIHPDGMISSLFCLDEGRRHDAFVLAQSKVVEQMEAAFPGPNNFYIYGDPAYPLRARLMVPFRGRLTEAQQQCNTKLSKLREAVEWGFCKIIQEFAFTDFKKNLKYLAQPVADYYRIAAFLSNCHSCLYGNQTATYYFVEPPPLEIYLA